MRAGVREGAAFPEDHERIETRHVVGDGDVVDAGGTDGENGLDVGQETIAETLLAAPGGGDVSSASKKDYGLEGNTGHVRVADVEQGKWLPEMRDEI